MGITKSHISISLDGFGAGPNETVENPLGEGGEELHEWALELDVWRAEHGEEGGVHNASSDVLDELRANIGATIMGRNMFGGGPGPWAAEPEWRGWWGDDPPYHVPVFVLTHHAREPLEMEGGTTFHFVTEGFDGAHSSARQAAGDKDVLIAGGPATIDQSLAAGILDELTLHVVPELLQGGKRLLEDVGDARLEQVRVIEAPGVSHLTYRVVK
jgi:dihydrofolate reductase